MNENEVLTQEPEMLTQDRGDAFLEGWGDAPGAEETADQRETEAQDQEPDLGEDTPGAEEQETGALEPETDTTAGNESAPQPTPEEQTWEINHLGEHKTMRTQDVTPELLQKGLDYDRVHQQYDRTKPVVSAMSALAKQAGMNMEDYVTMVNAQGKQTGEAVAAGETQRQEIGGDAMERDIAQFAEAFPEVYDRARKDTSLIPESVWEEVGAGKSLVTAYAKYAVDQAAQAAQAAQQNQTNTQRATGSMKSAGGDTKNKDPFLEGWGE